MYSFLLEARAELPLTIFRNQWGVRGATASRLTPSVLRGGSYYLTLSDSVCNGSSPPSCSGQTQAPALQVVRDSTTGASTGSSTTSWAYNAFGEPVAQQSTHGALALYAESVTRDKLGRITSKTETIDGA